MPRVEHVPREVIEEGDAIRAGEIEDRIQAPSAMPTSVASGRCWGGGMVRESADTENQSD